MSMRDSPLLLAGGLHALPLAGGTGTEILAWLVDHSRDLLRIAAHGRVSGPLRRAQTER
jgi:hypothetical protein